MDTRRLIAAACVVAAALGSATAFAGNGGPPNPLPPTGATPRLVDVPVRTAAFPVYDRHGKRTGKASWRMSAAGGNCCETYVNATPDGRIVESGGTYPWYTDDGGKHWYQVVFDVPDQNDNGAAVAGGEGATVTGPGGDVYGVTWDAYSGDHLQAFRYTAQTRTWEVAEVVMKSPFYDRPWLTYAKGPFVLDGLPTNEVLDVTGGGITKDIDTLSPDGLDYGDPSFFYYDETHRAPAKFRIPVVRNPDADWWQPHPGARTLPLTAGGVLRFANSEDITGTVTDTQVCDVARLKPSNSAWQCVDMKAKLAGVVRQDSRGYLTEVYPAPGYHALVLATSRDGGLHWQSTLLKPPPGAGKLIESEGTLYDVVTNGALGQAVVSARVDDLDGVGHDMVFRVDIKKAQPRLMKTYLVGKGDINTTIGVTGSAGYRFDYESVALLPDGRIAVTFDDSTCIQPTVRDSTKRSPEVAILM
jgi:hypothetical protein